MILSSLNFCVNSLSAGQGISLVSDYQKNSSLQWNWAMESLKKFPFNENDKVLDVGCGDGKITALIAEHVTHGIVIGLDISEKMLAHASANFSSDNLLFVQGNATSIPFKQQFDKLISFCTLHWVLEQKQALQSFKDSLKPGGALLLILPGKAPSNLGSVSKKIACSEKWSSYFPHFKQKRVYYTKEEYLVLLEKVQFEVQSLEVSETITKYADKEALTAYIKPLVNFIDHLSPNLQEDFINDIVERQILESNLTFPDGSIGLQTIKIEVIALNPK